MRHGLDEGPLAAAVDRGSPAQGADGESVELPRQVLPREEVADVPVAAEAVAAQILPLAEEAVRGRAALDAEERARLQEPPEVVEDGRRQRVGEVVQAEVAVDQVECLVGEGERRSPVVELPRRDRRQPPPPRRAGRLLDRRAGGAATSRPVSPTRSPPVGRAVYRPEHALPTPPRPEYNITNVARNGCGNAPAPGGPMPEGAPARWLLLIYRMPQEPAGRRTYVWR